MSIAHFQEATNLRFRMASTSDSATDLLWSHHLDAVMDHMTPASDNLLEYQNGARLWTLAILLLEGFDVTVQQDRVYAIMHLASDYEDGGITVDYSKSMVEVAIDAAIYHVQTHSNLSFLVSACLRSDHDEAENSRHHPTWLPHPWCGESGLYMHTLINHYDAISTKCSPEPILPAVQRLKIRGMRVDFVESDLTQGLYGSDITARQFWDSLLGLYISDFAGTDMERLSDDLFTVLTGLAQGLLSGYNSLIMHTPEVQGSGFFLKDEYIEQSERIEQHVEQHVKQLKEQHEDTKENKDIELRNQTEQGEIKQDEDSKDIAQSEDMSNIEENEENRNSDHNKESEESEESEASEDSEDSEDAPDYDLLAIHFRATVTSGLWLLKKLGQDPSHKDTLLRIDRRLNTVLRDQGDFTERLGMDYILTHLRTNVVLLTESGKLCWLPAPTAEYGDEIWFVLGSEVPIILRPQENGHYWHVGATTIPALHGHTDLKGFTDDIQPEDEIGDWIVEDIELE
jgi:hypothetical protein